MARPIAKTPPLEDEDGIEVLKKMQQPPTKKTRILQEKLEIKESFYFRVGDKFI